MINKYFSKLLKNVSYGLIHAAVFLWIIFPGTAHAEKTEVVDRIVAIVNDDIISLFELEQAFKPYTEKVKSLGYPPDKEQEVLFKVRGDILSQLIDQKLTDQETRKAQISVGEKEIHSAIERIKESNFYTDEDMRKALEKQGLTMEEFRKRIKDEILRSRLLNFEVKSKIVITKEEVKSYYEDNRDLYRGGKKYHLRNILMKVPEIGDDSKNADVKKKMESILEKLKAGQPFEKMAAQYSESSSASGGGDLGVFEEDVLSPQIQEAIKGMNAGEFTPVLDTDLGYQIFFIQEIKDLPGKSLEEATPEIEEKLFKEIVNKKFQSWLEDLRKRSHIKIIQ